MVQSVGGGGEWLQNHAATLGRIRRLGFCHDGEVSANDDCVTLAFSGGGWNGLFNAVDDTGGIGRLKVICNACPLVLCDFIVYPWHGW